VVDLINPPDDMEARRQEARRRRANREGLDLGEPVQDIDAIEETRRRSAPPPPAPFDAPPPPAGEEAPGRLVEFRKKDKKKKEQELRPEEDTYPGALPVPEVSKSRLISRLGEIKKSVAAKQAGKKKKSAFNLTFWTFAVAVLIPAVLVTVYLYVWAIDQYATEMRFTVRNMQSSTSAAAAAPTMLGSATVNDISDSYVVVEYLGSREFVEDLSKQLDLHKIYSQPSADWWYRMKPEISIEKMTEYVKGMTFVAFDMYTGIISVKVRAFSSADAKTMGDHVMALTESVVNRISERARRNVVRDAEAEVARAEARLRLARAGIAKFRSEEGQVDPNAGAQGFSTTINQLEGELTRLKAELNQLTQTMSPSAPRVRVQQSRVDALEKQIDDEKIKIALKNRSGAAISSQLARYEELVTERDFATQTYTQSLSSLERARMDAERNQRYLAIVVSPRPAQDSEYPERARYSFLSFLALFAMWAVCSLVLGSIRDHMQ